ncbi:helix-turn-helix transcriptional regulator [Sphingorhabdus sp.]|jgi:prophage regulatory protein|uniref:helix-turn-helix transcriptional regulator n=1 Tax=Sphingorhabdus sp. TaxID=1902408 RepID=UPI0037CA834A
MNDLLRKKDVLGCTGLSGSTLYELMAAGKFPKPVKISNRCVAWPANEVEAWIAARIAERELAQ